MMVYYSQLYCETVVNATVAITITRYNQLHLYQTVTVYFHEPFLIRIDLPGGICQQYENICVSGTDYNRIGGEECIKQKMNVCFMVIAVI